MKWLVNKNHLKIIIICMLFIFLPTSTAFAKENIGSISLCAHYLDDGKVIELSDVPFQIVKVADVVNGEFVNVGDFKYFKKISTNMNASQMKEVSYELQAYMKSKNISFTDEKSTNKNGIVQFSNLNLGLYFVSQKEKEDSKYYSEPFLLSIPMIEDSSEIFNVYSKPKFIEKDENEIPISPNIPDSSVGTGDNTNVILWTVLLLVSGLAMLSVTRKRKNNCFNQG